MQRPWSVRGVKVAGDTIGIKGHRKASTPVRRRGALKEEQQLLATLNAFASADTPFGIGASVISTRSRAGAESVGSAKPRWKAIRGKRHG
jgi:hypothetical protein